CLFQPPAPSGHDDQRRARGDRGDDVVEHSASSAVSALNVVSTLVRIAADFSPRYERHGDDLVSIDISGLGRLFGGARAIGEELRRDAVRRGLRVHVAVASTRLAALVLALARPGLTVVEPGDEADTLAIIPVGVLAKISSASRLRADGASASLAEASAEAGGLASAASGPARGGVENARISFELPALTVFRTWGVKTLGELAALPSADLAARLGTEGLMWQAIARGED